MALRGSAKRCVLRREVNHGGAKPILLVSHDAESESWQILTGDAFNMNEAMLLLLKDLVALDESLLELADLSWG